MTTRDKDEVQAATNGVTAAAVNPYHMAVQQFEAACVGYLGHLFAKSWVEPVQWLSSAILLV